MTQQFSVTIRGPNQKQREYEGIIVVLTKKKYKFGQNEKLFITTTKIILFLMLPVASEWLQQK